MKTHWKKQFNYDYLGSYSLVPGQDMILTIDKTGKEMVTGPNGQKEELFVCHFKEDAKPMIMNKTNCKAIESIYTPFVEDWPGNKIQLYTEKVKAFGEVTDALRIRSVKPDMKNPELLPNTEQWQKAIEFLAGGGSIENITGKYDLSKENRENLMEDAI